MSRKVYVGCHTRHTETSVRHPFRNERVAPVNRDVQRNSHTRRASRWSRPTAAHFFGAEASLAFAVMEDEAAPDADQTPAEKAAVMIQRMHRQNSFTSEDSDEKARRQWVNFHLANGQYEEASLWDGTAISEKTAQAPTPDGDAEDAEGAASDVADGTSGWSEEQAAASSKIAAVRKGSELASSGERMASSTLSVLPSAPPVPISCSRPANRPGGCQLRGASSEALVGAPVPSTAVKY
jgi:hypothetical protein